jgi:hypothetical protein
VAHDLRAAALVQKLRFMHKTRPFDL